MLALVLAKNRSTASSGLMSELSGATVALKCAGKPSTCSP
jgi:hypothetical protein